MVVSNKALDRPCVPLLQSTSSCKLTAVKSKTDCLPASNCPASILVATDTTSTCPASCVTDVTQEQCTANAAFGGAALQHWDAQLSKCVLYFQPGVADGMAAAWSTCKNFRGEFFAERRWVDGMFTTQVREQLGGPLSGDILCFGILRFCNRCSILRT